MVPKNISNFHYNEQFSQKYKSKLAKIPSGAAQRAMEVAHSSKDFFTSLPKVKKFLKII